MRGSAASCVQGTNDNSIVSKCSMVNMGYFDDPFIGCFVSKRSRRAPLINRGYYVRAKAVEMAVDLFMNSCRSLDQSLIQIISLGAGFDSLYFRIAAKSVDFKNIVFIEVDFMDVAQRKSEIIRSQDRLRNLIKHDNFDRKMGETNGSIVLDSPQYKLLGLDLCDIGQLNSSLIKCQVDFDKPTMFLSECAITYMPVSKCVTLWRLFGQVHRCVNVIRPGLAMVARWHLPTRPNDSDGLLK